MAQVIQLKAGSVETVFDLPDVLSLIDTHMGDEVRRWLEDWLDDQEDDADYIEDLEKDLQAEKDHRKEVMRTLREQSGTIARLIREKEIDRKALSAAAGVIGTTTWRELNV